MPDHDIDQPVATLIGSLTAPALLLRVAGEAVTVLACNPAALDLWQGEDRRQLAPGATPFDPAACRLIAQAKAGLTGQPGDHRVTVTLADRPVTLQLLGLDPDRAGEAVIALIGEDSSDTAAHRQLQSRLRHSEARFRALFENAHDVILVTDIDSGIIRHANRKADHSLGRPLSAIRGLPLIELFAPSSRDAARASLDHMPRTGYSAPAALQLLHADGHEVSCEVSHAILAVEGVSYVISVCRDVSAHRQVEQSLRDREQRLEAILAHAVDGFIVIDARRRIQTFNPASERMFGYRAAEVIGQNVNVLMPEPFHSEHDEYVERYLDGGPPQVIGTGRRVRGRRRDGSVFPMLLSIAELPFDEERMFLGICRDITDQERYEAGLRRAKEAAESANRLKTDFLATMSHELRTPLNAVIGFSEVMRAQLFGALGARQYRDYVNDIHRSASHLLSLINDILDIARIEAGKLEFSQETVDLPKLVAEEVRLTAEIAQNRKVHLVTDIDDGIPPVITDASRLRQILINLLSNAVKFTPNGGQITVSARRAGEHGIQIAVADTGIGIAKEALAHVTEPFYQVEGARSRHYGGSGLGLSIVKRLVEGLGGRMAIDSALGKGTTVSIMLDTGGPMTVMGDAQGTAPVTALDFDE